MQESKQVEIKKFCEENGLILVNIRNIKKSSKTRIVVTLRCKQCQTRFDIRWETLKSQKYKGLCTKCAHKESSKYKLLTIDNIIQRFEREGFKVVTPRDKIKGKGNRSAYFTSLEIMNKYGDIYTTSCNNFCNRIEYYKALSDCNRLNDMADARSQLEYTIRKFLIEQNIPFKQEFRFVDCKGKKYPLPFDFCLFYQESNVLLIEVDGEQHFNEGGLFGNKFEIIQKNDRIKNYYCQSHNIPLLRLSYKDIRRKDELYKTKILEFIQNNR